MEEKFISYKTAKLAKEKGFDNKLLTYYKNDLEKGDYLFEELIKNQTEWISNFQSKYEYDKNISVAPSQSLLQKWLREKRIDITVITDWKKGNRVYYVGFSFLNTKNEIDIWFSKDKYKNKIEYSEYEEALEVGLFESLQRVSETVA